MSFANICARTNLTNSFLGALLLIATVFHQIDGVPNSWIPSLYSDKTQSTSKSVNRRERTKICHPQLISRLNSYVASRPTFYDIALSHGTDKVVDHHYHHMYQKYLEPYREQPVKFLEIGLGCDSKSVREQHGQMCSNS